MHLSFVLVYRVTQWIRISVNFLDAKSLASGDKGAISHVPDVTYASCFIHCICRAKSHPTHWRCWREMSRNGSASMSDKFLDFRTSSSASKSQCCRSCISQTSPLNIRTPTILDRQWKGPHTPRPRASRALSCR